MMKTILRLVFILGPSNATSTERFQRKVFDEVIRKIQGFLTAHEDPSIKNCNIKVEIRNAPSKYLTHLSNGRIESLFTIWLNTSGKIYNEKR